MTAEVRARLAHEVEELSAVVAGRVPRRRARFVARAGSVAGEATAVAAAAETAAADRGLSGRVERLMAMEDLLTRGRVPDMDGQAVVGSRVRVYDGRDRIATYAIVLPDDADPQAGRIAPDSPMARALLGARPGDTVGVQIAGEERSILVVDVRYPEREDAARPAARADRRASVPEGAPARR
jgi:transcription elongation factor GreA